MNVTPLNPSIANESLLRLGELIETPVCGLSQDGNFVFQNQAMRNWHGQRDVELPTSWYSCVHPDDLSSAIKQLNAVFSNTALSQFECRLIAPDGILTRTFDIQINHSKGLALIVATPKQIHMQTAAEAHRARGRDSLTGLPNHAVFNDRVVGKLTLRDLVANPIAIAYVDVANFERINFNFGASAGDVLLTHIAAALESGLKDAKILARLPGCRFALMFEGQTDRDWAARAIAQIQACFAQAFVIDGQKIRITANIGFASTSRFINSSTALMRAAEHAVLDARAQGPCGYSVFSDALSGSMESRDLLAKAIVKATSKGEIELYYQPICSLRDKKIVAAEALVRWNHPTMGTIPASEFIELAEENGTILELGEWILIRACQHAKKWTETLGKDFRIAVNISPNQFSLPGFVDVVKNALDESGLSPKSLELDLSPQAIRQNSSQALINLEALRVLGVSISLDDFGTEGSSFTDLIELSPDRVKLDPRLVSALSDSERQLFLVVGLINTCLTLNIATTAECIENQDQLDALFSAGCDEGQGYFLHEPVTQERFDFLLAQNFQQSAIQLPATRLLDDISTIV